MQKNLLNLLVIVMCTVHCSSSIAVEYSDGYQKIEDSQQKKAPSPQDFIGKTFWYVPNPKSNYRIVFFSGLDYSLRGEFTPLEKTTFEVKGFQHDVYQVKFSDGKIGYVTKGVGFEGHIYDDYLNPICEYIFTENSDVVLARELQKEELAKIENENVLKKEIEANKAIEAERMIQVKKEKKAASLAKEKWKAKGGVSIGMTKSQVLASNWGKPSDVNKTTMANVITEQWVYDGSYLYFTNGKLTAVQN